MLVNEEIKKKDTDERTNERTEWHGHYLRRSSQLKIVIEGAEMCQTQPEKYKHIGLNGAILGLFEM